MVLVGASAVIGVLLGMHCRVIVLAPALLLALLVTAVADAGAPPLSVFLHMVLVVAALQICYLGGAFVPGALRLFSPSATVADEMNIDYLHRRDDPLTFLRLTS